MRDYTKFFTYPETAAYMAKLLDATHDDYIIEPSAGNGALVKAVKEHNRYVIVHAVEINKKHRKELLDIADDVNIGDFLSLAFNEIPYDGCIANPPFGNGIDLQAHFDKICSIVKQGGKVVMIVPADFNPTYHKYFISNICCHPLENWSKNSDGTTTPIQILEFING